MSSAVCVTQLVLSSTCRPTQFHLNLICVWETNSLHMFSDIFSPPNNFFSNMNFFSMYLLWQQRSASWNILKHPETHSNRSRRWWIIVSNENHFRALLKGLPEDQSSNHSCVFSPQWRERRWKNRKHQADPEVPVLHEPALPGGVVQRRDVPRGGGAAAEQVVIQGLNDGESFNQQRAIS